MARKPKQPIEVKIINTFTNGVVIEGMLKPGQVTLPDNGFYELAVEALTRVYRNKRIEENRME